MSNPQALEFKKLGNAAFSKGDHEEAIKQFTLAIEQDASDHVFFSNRSASYAGLRKFDEALKDSEECIRLNPSWAKGYSRQGLALFNLGRVPEAKASYEKGLEIDPNNAALKEGLSQVEQSQQAPANPFAAMFGPDIWVKIQTNPSIRHHLDDPQFVQNVRMLQSNPSLIQGMLGDSKIQQLFSVLLGMPGSFSAGAGSEGEPQEGVGPDAEEISMDQNKTKSMPEAAPTTEQQNEEELSEDAATKKESLQQKQLGNAAYKKRDFDTALRCYEKAQELDPTNAVFWLNSAAVKMETGSLEESIVDCRRALEVCQEHSGGFDLMAKAYGRIGSAQIKLGNLDDAIASFEKSLLESRDRSIEKKLQAAKKQKQTQEKEAYLDDEKALAHKELGNNLFREGKWTEAMAEYTESLRRNPKDHKVYSNRAACYTKLMDWGNAMDDVQKCLGIDPTFVKAYARKAKIEHFLKKYHSAVETYKAGLALDPSSVELQEGLQQVQMAIASQNMSGNIDPERQKRAMEDPQVQRILKDPQVNSVLQKIQQDPASAQKAFQDPQIRSKIEVLVNAGVLQMN